MPGWRLHLRTDGARVYIRTRKAEFPHFLWALTRFHYFAQPVAATAGHFFIVLDVVMPRAHADGAIIRGDLTPVLNPVSLGSSHFKAFF